MDDTRVRQAFRSIKEIVEGGNLDNIKNYVAAGRIDEQDRDGRTALHWSAKYDTVEIARLLVESKADLDIQDTLGGKTALHLSAQYDTVEIARLLVESKADLNIKDTWDGQTALHLSALDGRVEIARLLVESKADLNIQDTRHGKTALHWSAEQGTVEIARLLVESKADLNIQDKHGNTALHMAFSKGNISVAKVLINVGSNLYAVNSDADTPFELFSKTLRSQSEEEFFEDFVLQKVVFEKDERVDQSEISDINKKELQARYDNGWDASVFIMNNQQAFQKTTELFRNRKIKSFILGNIYIGVIKGLTVSRSLILIKVASFSTNKVMLLPNAKMLACVDLNLQAPWHIDIPHPIQALCIRKCKFMKADTSMCDFEIKCKQISSLYIIESRVTRLPENIGQIQGLLEFDIENNNIKRLPPSLSAVAEYNHFNVKRNPISNVPREILQKGKNAILSYLKDFYDESMIPNDRVKLILVGHEGVGKTTLVKALDGTIKKVEKTDGIEVSEIELKNKCKLNIFDFAGDVDFLESHSLFMTDDASCLVVFDLSIFGAESFLTSDSLLGRASLWLETIHLFAPHSRCILVGTHADDDKLIPDMLDNIWYQFRELLNKARRHHTKYHAHSHLENCLVCQSVSDQERESKYNGYAGYVEVTSQKTVACADSDFDSDSDLFDIFPDFEGLAGYVKVTPRKTFVSVTSERYNRIDNSGLIVPHITGYYEVSGTKNFPKQVKGKNACITHLKKSISKTAFDIINVIYPEIPEKWQLFRNELHSLRSKRIIPVLEFHEYEKIASNVGITSIYNVTQFLCSQGDIVYRYQSRSNSDGTVVVLSPQWLANQLRKLISFNTRETASEGILTKEELSVAWKNIDSKDRDSLMSLFIKMKICISIQCASTAKEAEMKSWLLPAKLKIGEPCCKTWALLPGAGEKQISYMYKFQSLPPLLFCDIIVNVIGNGIMRESFVTRNNIVFLASIPFNPCDKCNRADKSKDVCHVRFELIYHLNCIVLTVRGDHPCCTVPTFKSMIDSAIKDSMYQALNSKRFLACSFCLVDSKYDPGYMTESYGHYICQSFQEHRFKYHNDLLRCVGVNQPKVANPSYFNAMALKDIECPSMFVVLPINSGNQSLWGRFKFQIYSYLRDGYAVHLLCENYGKPHFLSSPGYRIHNVKPFIKKYGKHIVRVVRLIAKLLPLATSLVSVEAKPVVGAVAIAADESSQLLEAFLKDFKETCPDLADAMKEQEPTRVIDLKSDMSQYKRRQFSQFLNKVDENERFGALYPVPCGDKIWWCCEEHCQKLPS